MNLVGWRRRGLHRCCYNPSHRVIFRVRHPLPQQTLICSTCAMVCSRFQFFGQMATYWVAYADKWYKMEEKDLMEVDKDGVALHERGAMTRNVESGYVGRLRNSAQCNPNLLKTTVKLATVRKCNLSSQRPLTQLTPHIYHTLEQKGGSKITFEITTMLTTACHSCCSASFKPV